MSRAYKNKKYNKDNYIKFGVSPKYFGLQAKRFPGSVKKAYCDIDRDEEADVTFTKRRSPAVRKNYECLTVSNFAPAFGPQDLSQAVPELGPADLESTEYIPEQIYTVASFSDGNPSNLYGEPDGRWYPQSVDGQAIYLGEDAPYRYYAFPLIAGQRFTITPPNTNVAYFSLPQRGSGVGYNQWEWYWYKYTPRSSIPYEITGSAASKVKYNSYANNLNLGNPKFSLYGSTTNSNVFLRDLQYNPYNRFNESAVMAIKASLEAENGTGLPVSAAMGISIVMVEKFRSTTGGIYPPTPN